MITEKSKREILEAARIEDIVGDFVHLRRRGTSLTGLCPFHNEKSPSFYVNPARNIFKCFGCSKGGDPAAFLMEHEQLSFTEALRWIARKYNIAIEEIQPSAEALQAAQAEESLFIINQFAADFFQQQLLHTDRGRSVGLSYFRERGFTEETIRKFGLGFAPVSGDALLREAAQQQYNLSQLEELGLVKNGRDFFRERVMFSIHNLSGKIIAFAGRMLQKDAKGPKYINSPETTVYHKSRVLYGLSFARQAIRKQDDCILVEGYTDVLSLSQAGIEHVVASSGTALTVEQIRLIKRYTSQVTLLYDGDAAGIKAALRGVDLLLEQDMNVKVAVLPAGEDPDSFVRKMGKLATEEYLQANRQDFVLFKASLLVREAGNDPVKKAALIQDIMGSIARVPEPIKRSLYCRECAALFEVDEQLVVAGVNKIIAGNLQKHLQKNEAPQPVLTDQPNSTTTSPASSPAVATGHSFQELDLARVLIFFGGHWYQEENQLSVAQFVIDNIDDVIDQFDAPLYQQLALDVRSRLSAGLDINTDYFVRHEDEQIRKLAIDLLHSPNEFSENWEKKWGIVLNQQHPDHNWKEDSEQMLKRFRLRKLKRMLDDHTSRIREAEQQQQMEEVLLLLKVHQRIKRMHDELAQQLKTVVHPR